MTSIFTPAKVNLTLHVTGQRKDGYHLLDSLVCFPSVGDTLEFTSSNQMSLTIHGAPDLPTDGSNLILRAAELVMPEHPHEITLNKSLPVSSGIGGGSANAAAVIRYAAGLGLNPVTADQTTELGADVPVCVSSRPQRFQGIGDILNPITVWPASGHILLVNPGVAVATPTVFGKLTSKTNVSMPAELPDFRDLDTLVDFIADQRNDLQDPAIELQPVIADVLDTIHSTDRCLFARMSGSGATCFGIYKDDQDAQKAAEAIGSKFPQWWVAAGALQLP